MRAQIDLLHAAIDQAIGERVIKSAPEDIRAGINVQATKPWQDEQNARRRDTESVPYINQADGMPRIIEAAEAAINVLSALEAELARASAVAKKLGVSSAA